MKKLLNTAFIYALAAMAGGVFYREFTKFNGFSGRTALGLVHTHLFLLGTVFFLLAALFSKELDWARERNFRLFYGLYNTGLCVTAVMLAVRGAAQVLALPLSRGMDGNLRRSGAGTYLPGRRACGVFPLPEKNGVHGQCAIISFKKQKPAFFSSKNVGFFIFLFHRNAPQDNPRIPRKNRPASSTRRWESRHGPIHTLNMWSA